ncbi:unnamed protein product [Vitrella brassicaformis CCMP3155]|uniref:Homing endonuclease LAGLIDADG domain-containing protein n=1 Tax=Vitrella brassicaformis (strain CCMP3155) TaxID=1169540 RepID=A0A0G4F7D1_VITBC|nr:unnamed protein product [Vitrella brassicaformis CCMP3155]|eukprot:CEM08618.1 unnamed protein product [Vitrella brassicaformis CCMP3155]
MMMRRICSSFAAACRYGRTSAPSPFRISGPPFRFLSTLAAKPLLRYREAAGCLSLVNQDRRPLTTPQIVGLIDGEGCFTLYRVRKGLYPDFRLAMNMKDLCLLERLQKSLGAGHLYPHMQNNLIGYEVRLKEQCRRLVEVCDAFPPLTVKGSDYARWREIVLIQQEKGTVASRNECLAIAEKMNRGRPHGASTGLELFHDSSSIREDEVLQWLSGFIAGEGCFFSERKVLDTVVGFALEQHAAKCETDILPSGLFRHRPNKSAPKHGSLGG